MWRLAVRVGAGSYVTCVGIVTRWTHFSVSEAAALGPCQLAKSDRYQLGRAAVLIIGDTPHTQADASLGNSRGNAPLAATHRRTSWRADGIRWLPQHRSLVTATIGGDSAGHRTDTSVRAPNITAALPATTIVPPSLRNESTSSTIPPAALSHSRTTRPSARKVSPGQTGSEKRTCNRRTEPAPNHRVTNDASMPAGSMPCAIAEGRPADWAKVSSWWIGLKS